MKKFLSITMAMAFSVASSIAFADDLTVSSNGIKSIGSIESIGDINLEHSEKFIEISQASFPLISAVEEKEYKNFKKNSKLNIASYIKNNKEIFEKNEIIENTQMDYEFKGESNQHKISFPSGTSFNKYLEHENFKDDLETSLNVKNLLNIDTRKIKLIAKIIMKRQNVFGDKLIELEDDVLKINWNLLNFKLSGVIKESDKIYIHNEIQNQWLAKTFYSIDQEEVFIGKAKDKKIKETYEIFFNLLIGRNIFFNQSNVFSSKENEISALIREAYFQCVLEEKEIKSVKKKI